MKKFLHIKIFFPFYIFRLNIDFKMNSILITITYCVMIYGYQSLRVDNIPYCGITSLDRPVDIESMCNLDLKQPNYGPIDKSKILNDTDMYMDIYSMIPQEIFGKGYECFKSVTIWKFFRTFFNDVYGSTERSVVKLDAEDCLAMFQTKICSIKDDTATKLVCNGEY